MLTDAMKNAMLGPVANIDAISLHTADPGATGANEVAGGTYARQAPTWDAAAAGERAITNTPVFNVPGGTTVTHWGLWEGVTFRGSMDPTDEAYGGDGSYTINALSIDLNG